MVIWISCVYDATLKCDIFNNKHVPNDICVTYVVLSIYSRGNMRRRGPKQQTPLFGAVKCCENRRQCVWLWDNSQFDYETTVKNKTDPLREAQKYLSTFEVQLCKKPTREETKGKRGRWIPLLLIQRMLAVIQALVMKRTFAGVQYDLLFVKPGVATMPYTRHYCLRRYAKDYFANDKLVFYIFTSGEPWNETSKK